MIERFTELRFLATLRRIAKAMERANDLEQHRQEIEYRRLMPKDFDNAKKAVFSRPTNEDWNNKERHG